MPHAVAPTTSALPAHTGFVICSPLPGTDRPVSRETKNVLSQARGTMPQKWTST